MSAMVKGIIGGDEVLTEILVRGLTINGPADAYFVSHCSEQLGSRLVAKCGVHFLKNFTDIIPNSAVLFLTFDSEDANAILPKIAEKIHEWTLIVSVVHGLKLETLEKIFPNNEIVRLIVNPSIISGKGLSAYAVSKNASTDAKSMAEIVLKDCGDVIAVKDEKELEVIEDYLVANTYLSYIVIQTMVKNAKKVGRTSNEANLAVDKILRGSMRTLIDLKFDTADLISRTLSNRKRRGVAVELLSSYGMVEDLMNEFKDLTNQEKANPNDDPKNFRMHYQWSN